MLPAGAPSGPNSPLPAQVRDAFEAVQVHVNARIAAIRAISASNPLPSIDLLVQHLSDITDSAPLARVGFYGRRGAGKTTLLNRILGIDLLPTGAFSAVTAALTEIIGWDKPTCTAIIYFVSLDDWKEVVQAAHYELRSLRAENDKIAGPATTALADQLTALHGRESLLLRGDTTKGFEWEKYAAERDLLPADAAALFNSGYKVITTETQGEMKAALALYTDRRKRMWPLVFKIAVFGPFEFLRRGAFSLVDIPGNGDEDYTLGRRFAEGRSMCDRLFYLPSPETLLSHETANRCVDIESYLCSNFGVIVGRLDSLLKEQSWSAGQAAESFRNDLLPWFAGDDKRALFQHTKLYCLENGELHAREEYKRLFDAFVLNEFLTPTHEAGEVVRRYLNEVNLAFAVLRSALNLDERLLVSMQQLFTQVKNRTYVEADPQAQNQWLLQWQQGGAYLHGRSFPDLISENIHYATLQRLLACGGKDGPRQIPRTIVTSVLDFNLLQRLRDLLQHQADALRRNIFEDLKSGLFILLGSTDLHPSLDALQQSPPLTRFLADAITYAENSIAAVCAKELPNMGRSGPGCKANMLMLLTNWWSAQAPAVAAFARNAVSQFALEEHTRITSAVRSCVIEFLERLAATPAGTAALKKAELHQLLAPVSADPARNVVLIELAGRPVVEHTVLNLAPATLAPQQCLDTLCQTYPDILSPLPATLRFSVRAKLGIVYVLSNQSFRDGCYKIGETKASAGERARQLATTGVPQAFKVEHYWETARTLAFEKMMHAIFSRVRVNRRREFFNAPLELIQKAGDIVQQLLAE